jgi:tRNA threonylcarbamoyladenosine biosynthesis protein TsaB
VLLALDTSTQSLSLALVEGARKGAAATVVEALLVGPPQKQSDVLPGLLKERLDAHGLTFGGLEGFVVGLGPGSFTGLRIGLSTLKGLAYAVERPLVGASSLAALALDGPLGVEQFVIAVVKRGELYLGRYRRTSEHEVVALGPETSLTAQAFAQALRERPQARALGPALPEYRPQLLALGVGEEQLLEGPLVPSAVALARLVELPGAFDAQALFALEPHYLRGSGAEENPKFPPLPGAEPKARLKEDER